MADDQFTLTYDGAAVEQGFMDVRELAPALLSVGELINTANRVINGDRAVVSLQVKSDFKRGSFTIDLVLVQNLIDQAKQFLAIHPHIKDAKEILDQIFFWGGLPGTGVLGLFKFIKWLRGRNISSSQMTFINNGTVNIVLGEDSVVVTETVLRLAQDETIRRYAEGVVQPLKRDGISELMISGGDSREDEVDESDIAYFESGFRDGETLLENSREAFLEIVRLSFNQNHKWGFTDGTVKIRANITDPRFWQDVRSGLRFAKGDHIVAIVKTRTYRTDSDEIKSEYTIEQVVRHIPRIRGIQNDLPFREGE